MNIKLRDFESQILYFNGMYKLPIGKYPSVWEVALHEAPKVDPSIKDTGEGEVSRAAIINRLESFKKTISDEITEVDDIICSIKLGFRCTDGNIKEPHEKYTPIEFLTDMADWLGDIQVYCASEMAKFGLPLKDILRIIMSSNFSKLGADGEAIYDANGKVQKGPAYWKPEPQIKQLLEERIFEVINATEEVRPTGIIWR